MTARRVAVVTGAGSGIGRAMALACAREGMALVIADVEAAALEQTRSLLEAQGAPCHAQVCDVSKADEVEQLAEASWRVWGGVDWLFNNAGVAVLGPAWTATEADWAWVLGVNVMGVAHGVRSFVPRMIARGTPAHVVNTASAAGLATLPGSAIYCASKHAVVAFSECLAKDLEQAGAPISVSVVCPSLLPTGIDQSARNRPVSLSDSGPSAPAYLERVRAGMASSTVDASDVARMAIEAIRARRFYVVPHSQTGGSVRQRAQQILSDFEQLHPEECQ
ncbi:MAG TPA: SDR family NAD(P)-dependent oxidoreductase [Hydrogenophaga sp.]